MELSTTLAILRRYELRHRWAIMTCAGWIDTPWSDDADMVLVAMWLKGRSETGRVEVKIAESSDQYQPVSERPNQGGLA